MTAAGIPEEYLPNSVRHAMINDLYGVGLEEKEVNAYTGHSNNHHTTLNFYYHLDKQWVGRKLAGRADQPVEISQLSEKVARSILSDEAEEEDRT